MSLNHTVIVNHKLKGFGCKLNCSYCNWRTSEHLPHGLPSIPRIVSFAELCEKPFITFSGGGDPFYKVDEYGQTLKEAMLAVRHRAKKEIRVITREIREIPRFKDCVDYFSISVGAENVNELRQATADGILRGLNIETSMVLPPFETLGIESLLSSYENVQRQLGYPLVLRENLNSEFRIDHRYLQQRLNKNIKLLAAETCRDAMYLTDREYHGYDLLPDIHGLMHFIHAQKDVIIYGSYLKHRIYPEIYPEYGDIDLAISDLVFLSVIADEFHYKVEEKTLSASLRSPSRFFKCVSKRGGPELHVMFSTKEFAINKIFDSQFRCDRLYMSNLEYCFDPSLLTTDVMEDIKHKRAVELHTRGHWVPMIANTYRSKKVMKGFQIVPLVS